MAEALQAEQLANAHPAASTAATAACSGLLPLQQLYQLARMLIAQNHVNQTYGVPFPLKHQPTSTKS
jgi:uncharacterized protein VirK/YbjX